MIFRVSVSHPISLNIHCSLGFFVVVVVHLSHMMKYKAYLFNHSTNIRILKTYRQEKKFGIFKQKNTENP